ncbi:MAG TPA: fatty acyl-AMP ligase, partial [Solirubrobacterales bacterium]|nr:fatty acyl-AMP ligase [Solirubrobacterales bacterium]
VGGRALLLFPPGLDYVSAVYGCFQAGVVGVSAPPPHPKRLHRTLPRLTAIAADAEIDAVLTAEFIREAAKPLFEEGPLAETQWIATDAAPAVGEVEIARVPLGEMAFLQYTSGSTRAPRGVMLSHENLLLNSELISGSFEHIPNGLRKGLIWLPPYHDMGLIGGVLQPVHAGGLCILMSPLAVIKRPARWLEAMTRFRVTSSGGPSFAYDLCVRRIDDETCERLDLSDWDVAFNGAEPIHAQTIESFSEKFGRCGFRRSSFFPCYGLAEATLLVTGPDKGEEPSLFEADARALERGVVQPASAAGPTTTLVGCGSAYEGSELAIVDTEQGRRCEEGEIGEIWFEGPCVALGYWRQPEETEACFRATLADEPGTEYLRTGDLGAVVDGELYVVGRIKELIILNGRNLHPHDIEFSAEEAHPSLRHHCSAAFEQEVDGQTQIGILLEVNPAEEGYDEVIAAVGQRVADDLDLPLHWIGLCAPGTVPKTTSGKIQRRLCRGMLAKGDVELLAESRRDS